jgi:hypothetical protein
MTSDLSPQTLAAARWLAEQRESPARVISTLKDRFGLTAKEACNACALARQYRQNGRTEHA